MAYLIYTSGSTVKPKGVMIAYRSAANFFTNNLANIMVDILVKHVKNFVSVSTFSFDLSLKELALLLFNGLTLVLADKEQANNPDRLAELILKTGGEKYPEALMAKLRKTTKARIVNTYGLTETTISSNMKDLTCAEIISVGRPLLNVTEFIVDGAGVGKGYNNLPEMTAARFAWFAN